MTREITIEGYQQLDKSDQLKVQTWLFSRNILLNDTVSIAEMPDGETLVTTLARKNGRAYVGANGDIVKESHIVDGWPL